MSNLLKSPACMVPLTIVIVLSLMVCVVGGAIYGFANKIKHDAIGWQTECAIYFDDMTGKYNSFKQTALEGVGLMNLSQADQVTIGSELYGLIVEGRPLDTEGVLAVAYAEQYPDLSFDARNEMWADLREDIKDLRIEWAASNSRAMECGREYEQWLTEDIARTFIFDNICHFPNDDLVIQVGGKEYVGQDALDLLKRMIVSDEVQEDVISGTDSGVFSQGE